MLLTQRKLAKVSLIKESINTLRNSLTGQRDETCDKAAEEVRGKKKKHTKV